MPDPQKSAPEKSVLATLHGRPLTELPGALYIPPRALRVFLDHFEGPLDLLLYLIRAQNLEISDIPIAPITEQYLRYIELMRKLELDLAGEYLTMAAVLLQIKSRVLLPRPDPREEEEEADPRAELVRHLQEYERFRGAAEQLDEMPRLERDLHRVLVDFPFPRPPPPPPGVSLEQLMAVGAVLLRRAQARDQLLMRRADLSVRERMSHLLERLGDGNFKEFGAFLDTAEGRAGVVVTLLAILEMWRESVIEVVQHETGGVIHVRKAA